MSLVAGFATAAAHTLSDIVAPSPARVHVTARLRFAAPEQVESQPPQLPADHDDEQVLKSVTVWLVAGMTLALHQLSEKVWPSVLFIQVTLRVSLRAPQAWLATDQPPDDQLKAHVV